MTEKEVIARLKSATILKNNCRRQELKLMEIRSSLEKVTPSYGGVPSGGSGNRIEELTAVLLEAEEVQLDLYNQYWREYKHIEDIIQMVENNKADKHRYTQSYILKLHYLDGMRFKDIASNLIYDIRWIFRLHKKAIRFIADKLTIKVHI